MVKITTLLLSIALLVGAGPALAACPSAVPGNTAAEIQANGQRIVCLQNEVDAASRQKLLQQQITALERAQQDLQLEQRLDALPDLPAPVRPIPPAPIFL